MRSTTWQIFCAMALIALAFHPAVQAAESETRPDQDWHYRNQTAKSLQDVISGSDKEAADAAKVKLIGLLAVETQNVSRGGESVSSDEYSEYYSNLIASVGQIEDARAVDTLANPIVIKTGNMAIRGLAAIGLPAVPAIVSGYNSASGNKVALRTSYVRAASLIARSQPKISKDASIQIETLLLSAAGDPHPVIRRASLAGLAAFDDAAAQGRLRKIASDDPFKSTLRGNDVYPVRDAAKVALKQ